MNECRDVIEGFLEKIVVRYGRLGTKKRGFKEMGRALQWHMFEMGEVGRLREKLERANVMVQIVLMQAQR